MRRGTVEYPCNQGKSDAWIIKDVKDLMTYIEYETGRACRYISKLLKSSVHPERWDHMITRTPEGATMAVNLNHCKVHGESPALNFDKHLNRKHVGMIETLCTRGETIIVNDLGGYFGTKELGCIVDEWDEEVTRTDTYDIVEGCKYINLENDPDLEGHTINWMADKGYDEGFSYITELHEYDQKGLENIFEEFLSAGGETVYVYTTATNVQQMYEYFDAAVNVGIKEFIFEFNAGSSEALDEFLCYAVRKVIINYEYV